MDTDVFKSAIKYNLITLDASKMVMFSSFYKDEDNQDSVRFEFDFKTKPYVKNRIVKSVESVSDCALFYQLKKTMESVYRITPDGGSDVLKHSLVYVDFSNFDISLPELKKEKKGELTARMRQHNLEKGDKAALILGAVKGILGFTIIFEDGSKVEFVPFEKSASMSRNSRLSFIDKNLYEEINERMMVGIAPEKVSLSKYYAYRGLYFSGGHRVETKKLVLNEETVIILKDDFFDTHHEVDIFTTDRTPRGDFCSYYKRGIKNDCCDDCKRKNPNGECSERKETRYYQCGEKEEILEGIKKFDGEGLICPDYAQIINRFLKKHYGYTDDASSFQIRMPFTKGLLHTVDYEDFIFNFLFSSGVLISEEVNKVENPLFVEDCFGIKRDLSKAKIILTQSMFKCKSWLSASDDPVRDFFYNLSKYEHALYIGNTDVLIAKGPKTKINYQFLNTMDFSGSDMKTLAETQQREISDARTGLIGDDSEDLDEGNGFDSDGLGFSEKKGSKILNAVKVRPELIGDPKVVSSIDGIKRGLAKDLGTGRLLVKGEQRFLSRDLLSFLKFILMQSNFYDRFKDDPEVTGRIGEFFKKNKLYNERFYMPGSRISLNPKRHCVLLRNPHLSRNEQCALLPLTKYKSFIHDKYFGHLKGVVMISEFSLASDTLGGADFDGDIVKIIADRTICNAVLRGCYSQDEKDSGKYRRKLPIIKIPDTGGSREKTVPPVMDYDEIRNSFSNQIGQISNAAIKIGKKEYGSEERYSGTYANKCAECTIITGLEIDAAKTGVHPSENIAELKNLAEISDYFINFKDGIDDLADVHRRITFSDGKDNSHIARTSGKTFKFFDYSDGEKGNSIDCLPYYYYRFLFDSRNPDSDSGSSEKHPFEPEKWFTVSCAADDEEKLQIMKDIISAYRGIMNLRSGIYAVSRNGKLFAEKNAGAVINTLEKQYDNLDSCLPEVNGISVNAALDILYTELLSVTAKSKSELTGLYGQSLKKLSELNWHLTNPADREKILREDILDYVSLSESSVALLSNFDCKGYKLLWFVLNDLLNFYKDDLSAETLSEFSMKSDRALSESNAFYKKLKKEFIKNYNEKSTSDVIKTGITESTRQFIKDNFTNGEAFAYALKLRKKYDPNGTFFWDIFTEREIMGHLVENVGLTSPEKEEEIC